MQGTGYKDYKRWKRFYSYRHGENGNLGEIWDAFKDYHQNYPQPEGYTDESDWHFIGPIDIPLGHNSTITRATGKGMVTSLWVSEGEHSLIYAGTHHGGLWKLWMAVIHGCKPPRTLDI